MKTFAERIAFATALVCAIAGATPAAFAVQDGDLAPDFALQLPVSGSVMRSQLTASAVLVNFWASWCKPCRQELPALQALHDQYHDAGLVIIGVNVDEKRTNAERLLSESGVTFPVVFDPEFAVAKSFGAEAMPSSYLLDTNGRVLRVFQGFSSKKLPAMTEAIRVSIGAVQVVEQ